MGDPDQIHAQKCFSRTLRGSNKDDSKNWKTSKQCTKISEKKLSQIMKGSILTTSVSITNYSFELYGQVELNLGSLSSRRQNWSLLAKRYYHFKRLAKSCLLFNSQASVPPKWCPPVLRLCKLNFNGLRLEIQALHVLDGLFATLRAKSFFSSPARWMHISPLDAIHLNLMHILAEGDSLCTIRWKTGSCSVPWIMSDVVEVIELGKALEVSFSHFKRSANSMVDSLDKERISHPSLMIVQDGVPPPLA